MVAAANLPSANAATATPTAKTSLVTYDNLGNQVTLDVYLTNQGGNVWDVAIFDAADAPASGGIPIHGRSSDDRNLDLQPDHGRNPGRNADLVNVAIPNGSPMTLDMAQTTQLATAYTVLTASTNGNAPSQVAGVNIANNGAVSVVYQNGSSAPVYTVPVATVPSPDKMTVISGNAYVPGLQSGAAQIGVAGAGGLGTIQSSMQEASTVDLATELTSMIAAQNNYQADSKVFTTGSQLLQVLINLGK